jgi:nucleoid DNA-binding protein
MANTNQLARLLAAKEDISIAEATRRINSLFSVIAETLVIDKSESVKVNDFGSFKVKQRSGVCQGKPYSTKVVKFKPFKDLSNRVK